MRRFLFIVALCYSDEDRRFFAEAMQAQTVDVIKRMKEISTVMNLPGEVLEAQGITAEELEGMGFVGCIWLSSFVRGRRAACKDVVCMRATIFTMVQGIRFGAGFKVLEVNGKRFFDSHFRAVCPAGMLEELQEHVESIDMANGMSHSLVN
jgi:hypothetical protein